MKTYKIKALPQVKQDLANIEIYLSQFYRSTAAKKFALIEEKVNNLKENPYLYERYYKSGSDLPYRKAVAGNYLIFYIVLEEISTVEIYAIIDGRTNLDSLI